jgi:hypothetical protein
MSLTVKSQHNELHIYHMHIFKQAEAEAEAGLNIIHKLAAIL